MKNHFIQFAILLACLFLTQTTFADVKVKTRQTMQGRTNESTTYIKGKRQRSENGYGYVTIEQCDLRRSVQLMPEAKAYKIDPFEQTNVSTTKAGVSQTQTIASIKGGLVTTTITTKDTGERKKMFGYTARHLISIMVTESSPDACSPVKSKAETDGWYIDAEFGLNCRYPNGYTYTSPVKEGGCQDKHEVKQIGTTKHGYSVWQKMTMFDESGKETYSFVNEVTELSSATLDAKLFEVPAEYREVKDFNGASVAMSSSSSQSGSSGVATSTRTNENSPDNDSGLSSSVKNMATKAPTQLSQVGAKKEGVIRIGLANVKTDAVGEGMNASEIAGAIQHTLSEYLKSPKIELVPIEAKLPSAIEAEAKEKTCDFLIFANVSHKKGGGGGMFGKMLGNIAGSAVSHIGYGSTAGAIASQTASTVIYTAANASQTLNQKMN